MAPTAWVKTAMAIDTYSPIIMYKTAESYRTNEHRSEQNPDLRKRLLGYVNWSTGSQYHTKKRQAKPNSGRDRTTEISRERLQSQYKKKKNRKTALEPTTPVRYAIQNSNQERNVVIRKNSINHEPMASWQVTFGEIEPDCRSVNVARW